MIGGRRVLEEDGRWRPLKPGEFLLGHEDEVGPEGTPLPKRYELQLKGAYLVFGKLYQDLAALRSYLEHAAKWLYLPTLPMLVMLRACNVRLVRTCAAVTREQPR